MTGQFYIAFVPQLNPEGLEVSYHVLGINDMDFDLVVDFEFNTLEHIIETFNGILKTSGHNLLGTIQRDDLNKGPRFSVTLTPVTTEGTEPPVEFPVKIKASSFFKKRAAVPLLQSTGYLYPIAGAHKWSKDGESAEDLVTYTRRNKNRAAANSDMYKEVNYADPAYKASFVPEIDLHIEQLVVQPGKMSKGEKFNIQMKAFSDFLNEAIQLGEPRIYVIHGVGKGRLRNEIATRLIQHPDVVSFKNEFHPRYGFGATEILLQ